MSTEETKKTIENSTTTITRDSDKRWIVNLVSDEAPEGTEPWVTLYFSDEEIGNLIGYAIKDIIKRIAIDGWRPADEHKDNPTR